MNDRIRILCVDDEKNVLRAIRRVFLDDDYEILSAVSAVEGLEILRTVEEIQIVISDYRMPGVNGVDFLKKVYKNWPETVRIVLSGYADTAAIVAAINEGQIFKFIPKPWDEDELKATIQKAIKRYFLKKNNHQIMDELKASNQKLRKKNEILMATVKNNCSSATGEYTCLIYQDVLNGLSISILGIDSAGYIVQCNNKAIELLKKPETEILGSPWSDVLPEKFHPFVKRLITKGALSERLEWGEWSGLINGIKAPIGTENGLILTFDWAEFKSV